MRQKLTVYSDMFTVYISTKNIYSADLHWGFWRKARKSKQIQAGIAAAVVSAAMAGLESSFGSEICPT